MWGCRILYGLLVSAVPMLWRHYEQVLKQQHDEGGESIVIDWPYDLENQQKECEVICRKVSGSTGERVPNVCC